MKVELLKTTTIYKGKPFFDFYIRLCNGHTYAIGIKALNSVNIEGKIKRDIISELTLISEDYQKKPYVKKEETKENTSK